MADYPSPKTDGSIPMNDGAGSAAYPRITKIYLGIREKELLETYDLLDF